MDWIRLFLCLLVALPGVALAGEISGTVALQGKKKADGVWVFVEGEGPPVTDQPQADVVVAGLQFNPRGVVVGTGGMVTFVNKDNEFHQPFSTTLGAEFNKSPPFRNSEQRSQTFENSGIVDVYCHRHADMAMKILVLPNAWYAQTDAEGRFTISEVAAGAHRLTAWIDDYEPVTLDVQVGAEGATTVQFALDRAPNPRRPLVGG